MLAPEGRVTILTALVCAALSAYGGGVAWSSALWAGALFLIWLYLEPRREIPAAPVGIVSPVDGVVAAVDTARDPWLERDAARIRIAVRRRFGIGALLSPTEGKVMEYWTGHLGEASRGSPTRYALWIRTDEGEDVVVCVDTRAYSRLRLHQAPGERVGQGQRNGFVYFATSAELFLPRRSRVACAPGDEVVAGTSVLAKLVRETQTTQGAPGPPG